MAGEKITDEALLASIDSFWYTLHTRATPACWTVLGLLTRFWSLEIIPANLGHLSEWFSSRPTSQLQWRPHPSCSWHQEGTPVPTDGLRGRMYLLHQDNVRNKSPRLYLYSATTFTHLVIPSCTYQLWISVYTLLGQNTHRKKERKNMHTIDTICF